MPRTAGVSVAQTQGFPAIDRTTIARYGLPVKEVADAMLDSALERLRPC